MRRPDDTLLIDMLEAAQRIDSKTEPIVAALPPNGSEESSDQ